MLILPIGISGVGKTLFGKKLKRVSNSLEIVNIDEFRKTFGEKDVFNIAYEKTIKLLSAGYSVYFDFPNLKEKTRKELYEKVKEIENLQVINFLFLRSYRPDFAKEWIKRDLASGIDRPNTLIKIDGKAIVDKQFEDYKQITIKQLDEEMSIFKKHEVKFVEGNYSS